MNLNLLSKFEKKLQFGKKGKRIVLIRLWLKNPQLAIPFYLLVGEDIPLPNWVTIGLYTQNPNPTRITGPDRSDRSAQPVRPVDLCYCQFWHPTYAPLPFWWAMQAKKQIPKHALRIQNYKSSTGLKIMLRTISKYRPSSSSSVLPNTWVVFLQVPSIQRPG